MKRKLLSILLTFCMVVGIFPISALALDLPPGTYPDTHGHWAENSIAKWSLVGVLKGSDGLFRPNDPITRAELAAVLNRVIGYTEVTNTNFADVPSDAWYYSDVAKLYAAGIMQGDGNGAMRPNANITREEAVVLIARTFDVPENAGNENPFPDAEDISGWASFLVDGMKAEGYISGDISGSFNPKASITRAEVVTILNNMIDDFHYQPGEVDDEARSFTPKNAVVRSDGVTLKNYILTGNLWITEGVADGDVTLENVTVGGTTYIRGGGPNSVDAIGGNLGTVIIDGISNTHLELSTETKVTRIFLNASGSVTHGGVTVSYAAATGTITLGGTIDKVTLNTDGTATVTIGGMVYDIIPPEGTVTKFELAQGAVVKELVLDAPVNITGTGKIEKMEVHKNGVVIGKSVDVKPENIWVEDGVKITVGEKNYTGAGKNLPKDSTGTGGGGYNPPAVLPTKITFTATQAGGASNTTDSTEIVLTFSQALTGLTENHITITDDTGAVVKGALTEASGTGTNTTWTIALKSVTAQGDVTVSVADFGNYEVRTKAYTVAVFMLFTVNAYEDALPQQHLYGTAKEEMGVTPDWRAARINPAPLYTGVTEDTVVDQVTLRDFSEGSRVYLGNPADGGQEITSPGQSYTVTRDQLDGPGIWFIPPENNDVDFICYTDIMYHNTTNGEKHSDDSKPIRIIVDAVADQPHDFVTSALSVTQGQGAFTLAFTLEAQFDDYEDNSETHYFLVEKRSGWSSDSYITETVDGVEYFRIPVNTDYNNEINMGKANVTVVLKITSDDSFSARVYAVAQETPRDLELDYDNNLAFSAPDTLQYNP